MERNKEYDNLHNSVHLLAPDWLVLAWPGLGLGLAWGWPGLEPSRVHLATCTKIISLDPLVTLRVR